MASQLQDTPLKTITGDDARLADYAGKVLLIVNVASKCGLTPQYAGLEQLYRTYRNRDFAVLGFPANDFREQEPGDNAAIAQFCSTAYDVDFPMFAKITVTGPGKHPLYQQLTSAAPSAKGGGEAFRQRLTSFGIEPTSEPEVLWNFEKFLIGRDGAVVDRFAPTVAPDDAALVTAIERELAEWAE